MRIALVHDWLLEMGDRERMFLALCELFPGAEVFTLAYDRDLFDPLLGMRKIHVSALQSIPGGPRHCRAYYPLYWELIGRLDLSGYDLVISSSSVCAKWVRTSKTAMHVCYCHSPFPAAWGLSDAVFDPLWYSPARWPGRLLAGYLRWCERKSNQGVTHFMAASTDVQTKIQGIYGRASEVFFPPVEVERFEGTKEPGEYYLIVVDGRPTASVLKTVREFTRNGSPLLVLVRGSELGAWSRSAQGVTRVETEKNLPYPEALRKAKALICAEADADLLTSAEALAGGCPLLVEEGVVLTDLLIEGETGKRFSWKTLTEDLARFERSAFDTGLLRQKVTRFSKGRALFRIQVYFRRLFGIETQVENEKL